MNHLHRRTLLDLAIAILLATLTVCTLGAQTVPGITGGVAWHPQAGAKKALVWNASGLLQLDADNGPIATPVVAAGGPIAPVQGAVIAGSGPASGRGLVWTPSRLYRHDLGQASASEIQFGGAAIGGVRGVQRLGPAALVWTHQRVLRYLLDQPTVAPVEVQAGGASIADVHGAVFAGTFGSTNWALLWTATKLYRYDYLAAPTEVVLPSGSIAGVRGVVGTVAWTTQGVYALNLYAPTQPPFVVEVEASAGNPVRGLALGPGGVLIWTAAKAWWFNPTALTVTEVIQGGTSIAGAVGAVFDPFQLSALLWTPAKLLLYQPTVSPGAASMITWSGQPVSSTRGVTWNEPSNPRALVYTPAAIFDYDPNGVTLLEIKDSANASIPGTRGAITFPTGGVALHWTEQRLFEHPLGTAQATTLQSSNAPALAQQGAVCNNGSHALAVRPSGIFLYQQTGSIGEVTAAGSPIAIFDPAQATNVQVTLHFIRPSAAGAVGLPAPTPVSFAGASPGAVDTPAGTPAGHVTVLGASHEATACMILGPYPVAGFVADCTLRLFATGSPGGAGPPVTIGGSPQVVSIARFRPSAPALSADRRFVAYQASGGGIAHDVYVLDRQTASVVHVSRTMTGTNSNASVAPALSADGRIVAFHSGSSMLVPGDTNGTTDVFVRDLQTNQITRVSVASSGQEANGPSSSARLSGDGRYVVFESAATNLVAGDGNGASDVFVHDRQTGTTVRASVATAGGEGNGPSTESAIAADGTVVAFTSHATNLVAGDSNGVADVFVRVLATGQTTRVSIATGGGQAAGASSRAALTAAGGIVAFESDAALVAADTNGKRDVYVHDRSTAQTSRVSVSSAGGQSSEDCRWLSISDDGRVVAFTSLASNLVGGDTNNAWDAFVRDRVAGTTARVSVDAAGAEWPNSTRQVTLAADGRGVALSNPEDMTITELPFVTVRDLTPRVTGPSSTVALGGIATLHLSSPGDAGKTFLAASAYGYTPGIPLVGTWTLPLNLDPMFTLSLTMPAIFSGFLGQLDAQGNATLHVHMPAISGLAGLSFYTSAIVLDPSKPSGWGGIANAWKLTVVP